MECSMVRRVVQKGRKLLNQSHAYDYKEEADGWKKYSNNPVLYDVDGGSMFDPFVRKVDNKYIMCVSRRRNHSIVMYESLDGISWINGIEVLSGVSDSEWETQVNRASFLYHKDKWYLWYTGQHKGKSCIGLALSDDGIHFERYHDNPVMVPELMHENFAVMNPCVIWDEEQQIFKMWYAAGENYEPDVIAYAESSDGMKWNKRQKPVMTAEQQKVYQQAKVGACDIVKLKNGKYCMAYIAYQNINVARICMAYSCDGVSDWNLAKENPILSPGKRKWDGHAVYKPTIYVDEANENMSIWYNGRRGHCEQIGLARCSLQQNAK